MPWRRRIARRLRLWALALDPPQQTNYGFPPEWAHYNTASGELPTPPSYTSDSGELLAQLWRSHGMRGLG